MCVISHSLTVRRKTVDAISQVGEEDCSLLCVRAVHHMMHPDLEKLACWGAFILQLLLQFGGAACAGGLFIR